MSMKDTIERRPFPLGKLRKPYAAVVRVAERPKLLTLNRYPGQAIGVMVRLPAELDGRSAANRLFRESVATERSGHLALSIVWASPARWWK